MRKVFSQLVRELGEKEGKTVFEWYCSTYGVTIGDEAPESVKREAFE